MSGREVLRSGLCVVAMLCAGGAVAQTASPELHAVAGRPDVWPHDVLTKAATPSATKGGAAIPAGTAMKVVGLEGPLIDLDYGGALLVVPVAQTDFLERAAINLAGHPEAPAPRVMPTPVPEEPPVAAMPPGHTLNVLGATLEPALLVFDTTAKVDRLIPGGKEVGSSGFILLQLGGGRRWPDAMKDLGAAVQAARTRGADFETVLVPLQGSSVQSTIGLYRESAFNGPMVDPRKTDVVEALWKQYGHAGTFALALVDAKGQAVARTVATEKGVDRFHSVTGALGQLPVR